MPVRIASVLFVVCVLACAAQASPARAYNVIGPWWSDPDVTYNASTARDRAAAGYAARTWNRSGVGVRLRRTNGRGDILVRSTGPGCGGLALLGRHRPQILLGRCSTDMAKLVATHEFGHVIGFRHERRWCALMNLVVRPDRHPDPVQPAPAVVLAEVPPAPRRHARRTRAGAAALFQVPARGAHRRVAVAAAEQHRVHQQRE